MDVKKFEDLKIEPIFFKFLKESHSLSEAMDSMSEWVKKNSLDIGCICTNNKYEAELEQEWIEDRMKVYGELKMKEKKALESDAEQMFSKVLKETHDLSKTIDFMIKWSEENYPDRGYICTNNEQEALLEQEWIEDRKRVYAHKH